MRSALKDNETGAGTDAPDEADRSMALSLLADMVPSAVAVSETQSDVAGPLHPAERDHIAGAVGKRRAEFATVRYCAAAALRTLGLERPPMVPGRHREPTWPENVIGSMTHCEGYRAAAVALSRDVDTMGIDAEPNRPLPPEVLRIVASPAEAARLPGLAEARPGASFDRLLFSAKESLYKAWFPREQRWLGFEDAEVEIRPDGVFTARLLGVGADGAQYEGRWASASGLLATALVVPAGAWRGA